MPCAEFEPLLLDYAELNAEARRRADAHLASCPGCRSFLEGLAEVDARLTAAHAEAMVSPGFRDSVRRRVERQAPIPRLSLIPEILDFVGWAAVVAIVAYVINQLSPVPFI